MAYILTVDFVSVNGAVSYEKRWYEPTAYIINRSFAPERKRMNEVFTPVYECQYITKE